jgi:hypothetical protein
MMKERNGERPGTQAGDATLNIRCDDSNLREYETRHGPLPTEALERPAPAEALPSS